MSVTAAGRQLAFSPIRIGSLTVKNRLVMASTTTALGQNGHVTERNCAYYARRARGGVGTIVTEALHVHPGSNIGDNNLQVHADAHVPGLARLARAIRDGGAHAIAQLIHVGRQWPSHNSRLAPVAPSPGSAFPVFFEHAHVLTVEEIAELIAAFGAAARRVREAGFDGIEVHAAHGFLLQQFISGWSNQRTDAYGGSLENRLRFPFEVLAAVRRSVGDDFVVGLKFSADEGVPGGLTLDDTLEILPRLEASGRLDYFLVSVGGFGNIEYIHPTTHYGLGPFVHCAAAVKRVSRLPVMAVGKIKFTLEEVLAEGKADLVAMARPFICDPDLADKLRTGRDLEVRSCLSCNECHGRIWHNHPIACAYNPEAGRETEGDVPRAGRPRRVVVVGGGPAGCEAARVAALRGHEVTLLERDASLGGRLGIAAALPGRDDFTAVPLFYAVQLEQLGVDVRLGTAATPEAVRALAPDAVVVATGTRRWRPDIPGAEALPLWSMEDVIADEPALGRRVVVLDFDHHVAGMATADLLAGRGHDVVVVNPFHTLGAEVELNTQIVYHRKLAEARVMVHLDCVPVRVEGRRLVLQHRLAGHEVAVDDVDALVVASPGLAEDGLAEALRGQAADVRVVGDAYAPRRLLAAVWDAYTAARAL